MDRGDAMVDTRGIGQPFTPRGISDQDFGEWTHKVRTFMLARFGDEILSALTWAARQQRIVVKTCEASQRNRMTSWITVFGEQAGEDEIDNIDDLCLPCVLHNGRSKPICPKLWRRKWLASLETTAQRVRPDIVHETCGDSKASSEPSSLSASRGSWNCSGRLPLKDTSIRDVHRQERTTLPGVRRQPHGGDVLVDAKEPRGDCYVRQQGRGIRGAVRQTACLQQHETVDPNERKQEKHKEG